MNTDKPLISICIPVYNDQVYVRDAIESVINQTYQNWELIITDDCSTDTTFSVINTYKDPRIRIYKNSKNLGLCGNWNEVIKYVKGEYVKLIPSDDIIAPDCLEKQVAVFLSGKYSSVSLVTANTNIIDSDGKVLMKKISLGKGLVPGRKAIASVFMLGTNTIGEPAVGLVKASIFDKAGNYDESNNYLIDLDFWCRVLLNGDLYVIPEPLASFRVTQTANTTKVKNKQSKLFRQFAKKIHSDKRFKINIALYWAAYVNSYLMQMMRRVFISRYLKN